MQVLDRAIQTPGAILMGLGSIVGTGIFVSIAIAAQVAGNGVIIAVLIAAALAVLNGLSSAQLAAAHPVSGGTYEYGYKFLGSYFGFSAGWMFLAFWIDPKIWISGLVLLAAGLAWHSVAKRVTG